MKNQFKKSVSLFLAVLMVLSCWVWFVAPEEAEVEAADGQYYVKYIASNISEAGNSGNWEGNTMTINYKKQDGTDGSKAITLNKGNYSSEGYNKVIWEGYVDGFPTSISWYMKMEYKAAASVYLNVRGAYYLVGPTAEKCTHSVTKRDNEGGADNFKWQNNAVGQGTKEGTFTIYALNEEGTLPYISELHDMGAANIGVPAWGSTDVTSIGTFKPDAYDQYGVKWTADINYDYSVLDGNEATEKEKGVWATEKDEKATFNISAIAQENYIADKNGYKTFKLTATTTNSLGRELTSTREFTVEYSPISYVFNADGSVAGLNSTIKNAEGIILGTGSYTANGYIGHEVKAPTNESVSANSNYVFLGFWTKPQPAGAYNSLEADFAFPVTSTEFAGISGDADANGVKVDETGIKRYDAGEKWNPEEDTLFNDNKTFYGWWFTEDISVKFYDVDGKFISEQTIKAGQMAGAVTWPESAYLDKGYTSGAFSYTVDNSTWINYDGTAIPVNGVLYDKDGKEYNFIFNAGNTYIFTPKINKGSFDNSYTIRFINPTTGGYVAGQSAYTYRDQVKVVADQNVPTAIRNDLAFSYEFLGWSNIVPTTGANYHVLLEDADFDVNGIAITLNSDWVVRNDATYYAVYRRYVKTYVVNFNYKDAAGEDATTQVKIAYGENLVPPTDDAPYSYVTMGYGYTFKKWDYTDEKKQKAELAYDATLPFNSENINITAGALDGNASVTPIVINATYGDRVATKNTITFNYVDEKGNDVTKTVKVDYKEYITQETVDELAPAETWDDGEYLYEFAYQWEIISGAGSFYDEDVTVDYKIWDEELIEFTPTSNVTFKAVYIKPVPFYTVTYIDGANTWSERVLEDSKVPAWTYKVKDENGEEIEKVYVPADYDGDSGKYVFQGWYDEKQKDTANVNGNKITTANKVTGNLTLYSQFKFEAETYTIKFMNHDGSVQLGIGEFKKGDSIEHVYAVANKAAQLRDADETYTYTFIGWDKNVPTFCEGYDVTYTALYKKTYKYYDVKWYNSTLDADGNWVADKSTTVNEAGDTVEANLLATTKHTYNSRLYTPSVKLVCSEAAGAGKSYIFDGWCYIDAEGNAVKYVRGMVVTGAMEFYATYTLKDIVYTITTVVNGVEKKYDSVEAIPTPKSGYVDATKHNEFEGWYTDAEYTNAFDENATLTADIKIYAKFVESPHKITNEEIITAPTYYSEGEKLIWCDCDKNMAEREPIPMLSDNVKPTGTIYLGDKSWSSNGTPANTTDNDEISIFVNANTDVIITANDTGDVNDHNPAGLGKGVKLIRAFVFPAKYVLTRDNYNAAAEFAINVYEDATVAQTNNANFAVKLGGFVVADLDAEGNVQRDAEGKIMHKELTSGEAYIIYYTVIDKAGNQLNTNVRTAKFIYDNEAPAFTVEGEANKAAVPTYCGTATVTGIEKGVTLKVNDEEVTVTFAEDAEKGTYAINFAEDVDNVIITAIDKAGNTYSKKIKVADHVITEVKKSSTCDRDGYVKHVCTICGHVESEIKYTAPGHVYVPAVVSATCTENGYEVLKCETCGNEVTNVYKMNAEGDLTDEYLYPAHGHEIPDEFTTVTASTCTTYGTEVAVCKYCNGELEGGKIVRDLTERDANNHEKELTVEHLDPTCVLNGSHHEYYACCNVDKVEEYTIEATGHGTIKDGTAEWYVITESTCYQEGEQYLKCLKCTNFVTDENGNVVTEAIPATEEHVKIVANPDTYKTEKVVKYKCATEGCPEVYEDKILVDETIAVYTVKFLAEGSEPVILSVLDGDYVKKTDVAAPEKEATKEARYTFEGWKDAEGKIYKLPLEVKSDMTLTASFKETKIKYTHIFKIPTTWTETLAADDNYKVVTLMGTIGEVKAPSSDPVFTHKDATIDAQLKKLYTFEFKGWKNSAGQFVTDFTVEDDAVFTAEFEAVARKYRVLFYNGSDFVWEASVDAGTAVAFGGTIPTKNYDADNHYSFEGWYTDAALTNKYVVVTDEETGAVTSGAITDETRLYAKFTATVHDLALNTAVGTVVPDSDPEVKDGIVQKADCLKPEIKEYICSCGYTKQIETADSVLGHDFAKDENGNVIYTFDSETGKEYTSECSRCGIKESREVSNATIKFTYDGGSAKYTVKVGETVSYAKYDNDGKLVVPTKAADAEYTYKFIGWKNVDGIDNEVYAIDHVFTVVSDKDVVYKAEFEGTKRSYTVKYIANDSLVAKFTLEYGTIIPAYTGDTSVLAENFDRDGHDVFAGWSFVADGEATVTGNLDIIALFEQEEHDYESKGKTEATCISGAGEKFECKVCGHVAVEEDSSARGDHKWETIETQQPNFGTQTDGYVVKKCTVCNETKRETISGKIRTAKVTVKDVNGAVVEGATVTLYKDGEPTNVQITITGGVTVFTGLEDGTYKVFVKYPDGTTLTSDIEITVKGDIVKNGDITVAPEKVVEEEDTSCKCACHKDTFWGIIYRLFQKLISVFTGKANCCACPDERI